MSYKRKSYGHMRDEFPRKYLKNDRNRDKNYRISQLIDTVTRQKPLGHLIIIQHENEIPYVTLLNALNYINLSINIIDNSQIKANEFILKIRDDIYARGIFLDLNSSKYPLAEIALNALRQTCFYIERKKIYTDVTNQDIIAAGSTKSSTLPIQETDQGSKAHQMMLKMGWSGKGLGSQEQGNVETVTIYENINRQGLGSNNIMKEIETILTDFSKSTKLTTLAFDPEFTKEEREHIHKLARKWNLKSKSDTVEVNGERCRRLTVQRKLTRIDLVRELLSEDCENGNYKLHIPPKFLYLWQEN